MRSRHYEKIALVAIGVLLGLFLIVMSANEEVKWQKYAQVHCKVTRTESAYYIGKHFVPARMTYMCDDGVEHTR